MILIVQYYANLIEDLKRQKILIPRRASLMYNTHLLYICTSYIKHEGRKIRQTQLSE
jgi:hypothetical protein